MSNILKGESLEHRAHKLLEAEKLINLGYKVETEKILVNPENSKDTMRVDVYGEKDDCIAIREIVKSSFSGKDPNDYLKTDKTIDFRIITTENSLYTKDKVINDMGSDKKTTISLRISIEDKNHLKNISKVLSEGNMSRFISLCINKFKDDPFNVFIDYHSERNRLKKTVDRLKNKIEGNVLIPYEEYIEYSKWRFDKNQHTLSAIQQMSALLIHQKEDEKAEEGITG
jgi:hypothetical protein